MSAAAFSSPSTPHTTPTEVGAERPMDGVNILTASQDLRDAFHETRVQLLRSHDTMRQLMLRCEAVGTAMERCAEAVAALPGSGNTSFANAPTGSSAASDGSAAGSAASAAASHRQLYWSLAQFHTHVAQLLSAASLRAYDAAVADKIANRLSLLERGAETFHHSVVVAQRQAGGAGAVQGSARQLEQLACTRFAPAYEGFLLYTVATLGDLCALWDTAAQRSAEAVVWSSGQEAQSPGVAALHAEHSSSGTGGSAADAKARRRRPSATTLSAAFATAVRAAEELRDALFTYVRLLHGTAHEFAVAATTLSEVLGAVLSDSVDASLTDCFSSVQSLSSTLEHSQARLATRKACYEAIVNDGIVQPLRQLQENSKKGVRLDMFMDAVNYPLMERTSTIVERLLRRLSEPRNKEGASREPSRSNSTVETPSSPMEVLFEVWQKATEVCLQLGNETSNEFTNCLEM